MFTAMPIRPAFADPPSKHLTQSQVIYTPPRTPTALSSSAHQLHAEVQDIYNSLTRLDDLKPGPQINTLLTRLVDLCIQPYSDAFAAHFLNLHGVLELCRALRPICGAAEGELERYWARKLLDVEMDGRLALEERRNTLLSSFPYYQNYLDLSRLECSTLEAFLPHFPPSNIAFIGSGPMPLSSFCLLDRYPSASVHNVDRDESALEISIALAEKLGYGSRMTFSCENADDVEDGNDTQVSTGYARKTNWRGVDVVFLAALVGMDSSTKIGILASLARKLKPGTLVVARTADRLRSLLYPVLEISYELQEIGYEVLAVVHPWTKVVNSVAVLRVK